MAGELVPVVEGSIEAAKVVSGAKTSTGIFKWLYDGAAPKLKDTWNRIKNGRTRILIIGCGGVGKTSLVRLLSGDEMTVEYTPTVNEEESGMNKRWFISLEDTPAQDVLKGEGWKSISRDVSNGKYSGIIFMGSYGYHSFPSTWSYRRAAKGLSKETGEEYPEPGQFVRDWVESCRKKEIETIKDITKTCLSVEKTNRMWLLVVANKQDIWLPENEDGEVERFYKEGNFGEQLEQLKQDANCRVQYVEGSLGCFNFTDSSGEEIWSVARGFDHHKRRKALLDVVDMIHYCMEGQAKK